MAQGSSLQTDAEAVLELRYMIPFICFRERGQGVLGATGFRCHGDLLWVPGSPGPGCAAASAPSQGSLIPHNQSGE